MVELPCFSENLTLFFDLFLDIIAKFLESSLELLLEGIQGSVHIVHLLNSLLLVLLDIAVVREIAKVRKNLGYALFKNGNRFRLSFQI